MHGHQQIVDELDFGGGAECTEIETGIGETSDDALHPDAGIWVTGEENHALALPYHAGGSGHFAVNKSGPLRGERGDLSFLYGEL